MIPLRLGLSGCGGAGSRPRFRPVLDLIAPFWIRRCLLVFSGVLFNLYVQPAAAFDADRVFINGNIWTGEDGAPRAQALAVRDGRITAVGSTGAVLEQKGPHTEVIDLQERFVSPGFIDAHLHLLALERVELEGAEDLADIRHRIAAYAKDYPESPWIQGRGWTYSAFPDLAPHRSHIDAVLADRPVILTDRDGHTALANSKALALAGITRDTKDPRGGLIVRDPETGEPTGHLKEVATRLVYQHVPEPSQEELRRALNQRLSQAAAFGLTSVQNASPIDLPVWEQVAEEGGLKVRVYAALSLPRKASVEQVARYRALRDRYRGPLIKYGALKGFLDGTIDSKTAALFEPYIGGGGTGIPMWTQEELDQAVSLWDREGFQVMLHAIGDKAVHMALDACEYAARVNGTSGRRHRIEHIELPLLSDLARFKTLGVIASTQAIFANPDRETLENFQVVLGPDRASRADAFRLFDDAGIVQAFGSDFPVFSMDVLRGMYAAITRTTPEGTPPGGWFPENRISAEAALRHFTKDAAYASFDEQEKGTLTVGKFADFVVLSEDILETAPNGFLTAKILRTVMDGRDTYLSPEF